MFIAINLTIDRAHSRIHLAAGY